MGLFGRKKDDQPPAAPAFDPQVLMGIPPELARAMLTDWAQHHGGSFPETMSATLEFDEHSRVSSIKDPRANGLPYVPTADGVGWLNQVLQPMAGAPAQFRPSAFSFSFDRGEFSGEFRYPETPAG